MNYINRFQNAQDLSVSLRNTYSEYQLMRLFLDIFHTGVKYSSKIASNQKELRREGKFTDKKTLSISSLQTDYQNIERNSGFGKYRERANLVQTRCTYCGGSNHSAEKCFKRTKKENEKSRAAGDLDDRRTECTPRKCFRCGPEYNLLEQMSEATKR